MAKTEARASHDVGQYRSQWKKGKNSMKIKGDAEKMSMLLSVVLMLSLFGCAIAPTHPSLTDAALPELIPVRNFVADRKSNGGYQVSPDGKKLTWMAVKGTHPAVFVKTIGDDDVKVYGVHPRYFRWAGDSRHLLLVSDKGGDENTHIYVADVEKTETELTDLTPYERTVAHILRVVEGGSKIVVMENRRNKKVFDLCMIDVVSGQNNILAVNHGDVSDWVTDRRGNLIARVRQADERRVLEVKQDGEEETWKPAAEWSVFDTCSILEVGDNGKWLWALSNRGRDKNALVKVDLATGGETIVYAEPDVDIEGVLIGPKKHVPIAVYSDPDYPKPVIFDSRLRDAWLNLTNGDPAALWFSTASADDQERLFAVSIATDRGMKHYLYDAESGKEVFLGEDGLSRMEYALATVKPVSFESRDGLTLNGYLTLPVRVKPDKLPMVLVVHGGPWMRNIWAQHGSSFPQFLANRGYAVLQVNYGGSTGYGREFMERAVGEFAGKMHNDLIDGVNWAVRSGIADPGKIAILGGSYGGYASLVGLTFTPETFACGVDIVGPSDLARLIETVPEYWELGKPWWYRYVGNPSDPEDRKIMDAKSPIFKAGDVTKPVLIMHGVNDPRVKLSQSEEMVRALRKAGKQVDFVVFGGEGHGNREWANNLKLYRKTEDFLAACLAGSLAPIISIDDIRCNRTLLLIWVIPWSCLALYLFS